MAGADPGFGGKAFERARRAVVAQHDRLGIQHLVQRVKHERHQPINAGGIRLHGQHPAEPVDDQTGQSIRLGMHQPVIRCPVQPLAQPQRAFEMAQEEPLADRARRVAIEKARGEQGVRVEHRHAERALVAAPQRDERTGRERLGRRIHRDFIRKNPGMAGFGAAMPPRKQGHDRPPRRIVGLGLAPAVRHRRHDRRVGHRASSPWQSGLCCPI